MVHDVLVVSVTNNRQFVCQFHKLLVMDNDMMATISSCALLFIFVFLCCYIKKGTLSLVLKREWITTPHHFAAMLLPAIPIPVPARTGIGIADL